MATTPVLNAAKGLTEEINKQMLEEAVSATPNFETDYSDERFGKVDQEYQDDMTDLQQTVGGMIDNVDGYYKDLQDHLEESANKQMQLQQEQTDFAIEKIEQQKEQAQKDYLKEQSGAYVDWQKQSNAYGAEAEKMASAGLTGTGYSESSQVAMYNTYQNRVATAREVLSQAKLNYDNNIKEAMLQNNAVLAEIWTNMYTKQLELALEGFQYKNQLVLDLADRKREIKNDKWQKELAIIQQQNTEKEMAWNAWKYEDEKAWKTEQAELDHKRQLERDKINNDFDEKLEGIKHDYNIKYLNAETEKEKEVAKIEHENKLAQLKKEQEYALARIDKEYDKKLASEKALLDYQSSKIADTPSGYSGYKGGSNVSSKGYITGAFNGSAVKQNAVNTAYYSGAKNSDANVYGTFSNGYQPKGISGHGTLKKTGKTIEVKTQTLYGQKQTVVQNVWKAEDGTKWYWEGRQNKYVQIK